MVPLQGVIRVPLMLEEKRLPVAFGVTVDALFPKASLVRIVFLVATDAINRSLLFIEWPFMAGLAFRPQMSSKQRVFGMKPVVKDDCFPVSLCVTGLAFLAIGSLMFIILLMAGVAVCGSILERWCEVTFLALDRFMLAKQGKTRLIVVEWSLLPGTLVVALFTLPAFLALMLVVLLVAGVTVERGILIAFFSVAFFACHVRMFASKGILGLVMIESYVLPIIVGMTIHAALPDAALVRIVFFMTGITGRRCLAKFCFGLMAGLAFNLLSISMRPPQDKVRSPMIKRPFIDGGNILGPSFMLGVTIFTVPLFFEPPVKA